MILINQVMGFSYWSCLVLTTSQILFCFLNWICCLVFGSLPIRYSISRLPVLLGPTLLYVAFRYMTSFIGLLGSSCIKCINATYINVSSESLLKSGLPSTTVKPFSCALKVPDILVFSSSASLSVREPDIVSPCFYRSLGQRHNLWCRSYC